MDEQDYEMIARRLADELARAGLGDLADPALYAKDKLDPGGPQPGPWKVYAVGMMEAFERHLSIMDVATYKAAMDKIRANVQAPNLADAVVELPSPMRGPVSLGGMPDLAELRNDVRELAQYLKRPDGPAPGSASSPRP